MNDFDTHPFAVATFHLDVAIRKAETLLLSAGTRHEIVERAVGIILAACVEAVENSGLDNRPADVIREVTEREL
jgi:hypothetical protein